jgi:aromatic amino acid aminotransferase I
MEAVLANWDEARGPRPRLLYSVPTGQNPTGATMLAARRKAVYDICSRYDVVIVEDEPYYCLFMDEYVPRGAKLSPMAQAARDAEKTEGKKGDAAFLKSLPPSFLHFDTDGRVIRFDTFSKTSCPGSRLGWITSSPIFIERLTRIAECGTQAPSGFATALTLTMLHHWGWDGYVRWLRGIKANYRMKRDWMLDALADAFHLEADGDGLNPLVCALPLGRGYTGYARGSAESAEARWDEKRGVQSAHGKPLVSFIPPSAGMFIFLGVHLSSHRDYGRLGTRELMDKLWRKLAEHHVLFAPGWAFDANGPHNIGGEGVGYFRLSFSIVTYEQTRDAMDEFAKVLKKFLA